MFFTLDELLIERRYALLVLDAYIEVLTEFMLFALFFGSLCAL